MSYVSVEKFGAVSILGCEGNIVRSEAAFALRDCVLSQSEALAIVLDLSRVIALGGAALGVMTCLHKWARDHGIRLHLFNPRSAVRASLARASDIAEWQIVQVEEVLEFIRSTGTIVKVPAPLPQLKAA